MPKIYYTFDRRKGNSALESLVGRPSGQQAPLVTIMFKGVNLQGRQ
jgi:hypothetical protein